MLASTWVTDSEKRCSSSEPAAVEFGAVDVDPVEEDLRQGEPLLSHVGVERHRKTAGLGSGFDGGARGSGDHGKEVSTGARRLRACSC